MVASTAYGSSGPEIESELAALTYAAAVAVLESLTHRTEPGIEPMPL